MDLGESCCICLQTSGTLRPISDLDTENRSLISKLSCCISEVNWEPTFVICDACTPTLDVVYNFHRQCLKADKHRSESSSVLPLEVCVVADNSSPSLAGSDSDCKPNADENDLGCGSSSSCSSDEKVKPIKLVRKRVLRKKRGRPKKEIAEGNCELSDDNKDCVDERNNRAPVKRRGRPRRSVKNKDNCELGDDNKDCANKYEDEGDDVVDDVKPPVKKRGRKKNLTKKNGELNHVKDDDDKAPVKKRGTLKFQCEHCPEKFPSSHKLIMHTSQQHGIDPKLIKPYSCDQCTSKFATSSGLIRHLKYHDGSRNFICTTCGKTFITQGDLKFHEKIHLDRRDYECPTCSKRFNTHKSLRTHKLVVHTDPNCWAHECMVCAKKFPIKSNFDAHMRRHNNLRAFACHLCDKKFIDKCVLVKHIKSHTDVRDFECDICNKVYKDKVIMERHRTKIHGVGDAKIPERVKRYFCHVCPKAYFDKSKLTRHLLTHTGEKPYPCTICKKRFSDKGYLKQHEKIHEAYYKYKSEEEVASQAASI